MANLETEKTRKSNTPGIVRVQLVALGKRFRVSGDRVPNLLTAAPAIISVVVAYLYFAGWVFDYFYYGDFGVGLLSFDMPFQYFIVSSYTVFSSTPGAVFMSILLLILFLYATKWLSRLVLVASLIITFPILFLTARAVAHRVAEDVRVSPKTIVHISFKNPEAAGNSAIDSGVRPTASRANAATIPKLLDLDKEEQLHLLVETKDRIVVYYQPASIVADVLSNVYIYSIMRSDLQWSMVSAQ
jgi:hypothetical protein